MVAEACNKLRYCADGLTDYTPGEASPRRAM
jgi:hypothetical protein